MTAVYTIVPSVAMMVADAAYVVAALLFILSLAGLSRHETARRGVVYGIVGMGIALLATVWLVADGGAGEPASALGLSLLVIAVLVGGAIGLWRARVVQMTAMPQLIALFHSFVGLAAVLVGWNGAGEAGSIDPALQGSHSAEVFI
ncbi:MAG: NAD(P)(+) transhydrogenase (Re/Si-specific) subunit beta, partial [Microbacterium sp.]|nr:NAD(P)(+) transhydrogenase (Re/Si-specific) subunit beta [Microbacterium sp.]